MRNAFAHKMPFPFALFFFALLIGGLAGIIHLNNYFYHAQQHTPYLPLSLAGSSYELTNAVGPRINRVLGGRLIVSDTDLFEYKDGPFFWPPLAATIYFPFRWITRSVNDVAILSDIVFPIVIFLLVFLLFFQWSEKRHQWVSLIAAYLFVLYPHFSIQVPPPNLAIASDFMRKIIPTGLSTPQNDWFINRRESFLPGLLPLLLAVFFLQRLLTKQDPYSPFLAGLFFASNAYFYPYHFIYLSAGIACVAVFCLMQRRFELFKRLCLCCLTALIALVPFFINQWRLQHLPQYQEILTRFGSEVGYFFRITNWPRYVMLLALSALLIFIERRKRRGDFSRVYLTVGLLLAGIVVLNLQLLLGFSIQPDHWLSRDIFLGIDLAYFVLFIFLLEKDWARRPLVRYPIVAMAILGIASLSITFALNGIRYSRLTAGAATLPGAYTAAFGWLNAHTQKDSVVITPSIVSNQLLVSYTHNRIFVPDAISTIAPDREIIERFFMANTFFGVTTDTLRSLLNRDAVDGTSEDIKLVHEEYRFRDYLFVDKYVDQRPNAYIKTTSASTTSQTKRRLLGDLSDAYEKFSCDDTCYARYRIDYIFEGPFERSISSQLFSHDPTLTQVYESEGVSIYSFHSSTTSL